MPELKRYLAPCVWVNGRWANDVLLTVAADGCWHSVVPGAAAQLQLGATRLSGPVLPGLVNAHSHAFQRAIAGFTERHALGSAGSDDFWSWRDRMYGVANRITPAQLEVIASHLYRELLAGGYTQVCEFHYLHHGIGGVPYANPIEMSLALVRAAQQTGMGLTLLPTLYMRSGFGAAGLRAEQIRFLSTPSSVLRAAEEVQRQCQGCARVNVGVAIHSLRAVDAASVLELAAGAVQGGMPIHIHIAEQTGEVGDCVAHTGQRPIEWLLNHVPVDRRWNLVHATHATLAELQAVREKDAAIVICPATEANLGDGVFDLPAHAAVRGNWSIGSDSHITRSWPEELRLLEYSQRLNLRQRNVAARAFGAPSSAEALFEGALAGGSRATGLRQAGLMAGHQADFVVLDKRASALCGVPNDHILDALVFSSPAPAFVETHVAGKLVSDAVQAEKEARAFANVMQTLWSG